MSHRILITGASGYLGGTLLARWKQAALPAYDKLFAQVRTPEQAEAVKQYGAQPLNIDFTDSAAVQKTIVGNKITIIFYLINASDSTNTAHLIAALAEVRKLTAQPVHFLFTTGAKVFSEHAGALTDAPLLDTDPNLYELQNAHADKAPHALMRRAVVANNTVVETGERLGVRTYIFAPCIVYGRGEGFGNITSIQTVAIVRAAHKVRRVYKVDQGRPTWPVCHVIDNTGLYLQILRGILNSEDVGYGRNGYFLAASGSVAWDDIYSAMAKALKKQQVIDDEAVAVADDAALQKIADATGWPKEFIPVQIGGLCTFTPEHGKRIGWTPLYAPEHILQAADEEVELILDNLNA